MSVSFDRIATSYDATRGFPTGVEAQVGTALVHEAGLTPGMRLLEIGVGTGRVALPVTHALRGLTYVGVDISQQMMGMLRSKDPARRVQQLQADATLLPFADHSFEATLTVHVLHLVSDAEQVLAELWRVLRPGGLFLHGYNDFETDERLKALRYTRWEAFVEEAGGTVLHQARREALVEQISSFFGRPRIVTLARWQAPVVPRRILNSLISRSSSATWDIPEAIFAEAMRRTETWAQEQFGDLDQAFPATGFFNLEIYQR